MNQESDLDEVSSVEGSSPHRLHFVHDDALYNAVGRVVLESALLDELLRELLCDILGPATSDQVWLLFEGQSTEWLLSWTKILLNEADPYFQTWAEDHHLALRKLLDRADRLRVLRNSVVHGVWTYLGRNDPEVILPRPWEDTPTDNDPAYCCARSRHRSLFEARLFTVEDVKRLANEIEACYLGVRDVFRLMEQDPQTLPRW